MKTMKIQRVIERSITFLDLISFSTADTQPGTLQIMLNNEIQYLDKLLSSLLDEFKAQITTLVQIQEGEHKDLQRGYAYQKRD
jgi:hypothetical protein